MASMFARVARGYDRLNTLLSLGMHHRWRRFAVRECRFPAGGLALDIATGTADFLLELIGRGGRAVGIDPCAPMLAAGRDKLRRAGVGERALLLVGEAEHLPVPNGAFDCATIGFALRNVTDIDATFAEMARAVRPGGRVVALEIARPRGALFRSLFLFYFYRLSPWVARAFGGDPQAYQYLPNSLKTFQSREELAASMRRAGLTEVKVFDLSGGSVAVHSGTKPG
jgi:demethylmenaquinone methyltransferase/2-methoxy-6-polyprenyl-1,4-benzoquinol methylase